MTVILGIDPGLSNTGWGLINVDGSRLSYISSGVVVTNPKDPIALRLQKIHQGLTKVLEIYKPEQAAIEEVFLNSNAASSLKLGHARGVAILAVALTGIDIQEYAARLVKKSVVGVGNASKEQIAAMVKYLLPSASPATPDAADALAVAICHSSHSRMRLYDR